MSTEVIFLGSGAPGLDKPPLAPVRGIGEQRKREIGKLRYGRKVSKGNWEWLNTFKAFL